MKPRPILRRLACATPLAITLCFNAQGAAVTKSATGTDLGDAASWGGTSPTATDTATWTANSLGSGLTLGADVTWQGVAVTGGSTAIDISGSGRLNLGEGGFDLSTSPVNLSVANPLTLAANQAWKVADGRTLAVNGAISGAGGLQAGATIATASFANYLSTSAGSPTTVATGVNLADLTSAGGVIAGSWISGPNSPKAYQFTNNGTTATYQLQFYDGNTFTKVAKVQLNQSGGNIVAHQVYAKYKAGNFEGQNFDTLAVDGSPPTGWEGYGVTSTTLVFGSAPGGTIVLGGTNDYTGATTVGSGTLRAASNSAFGSNSAVVLSGTPGANLDLAGFNNTVGSLAGAGTVNLGNATLTVGTDNTSPAAFTGNLTGAAGSLVKTGTGTLTLGVAGPSDFGRLVVSSGSTVLTRGTGTSTTPIVVNDDGTGANDTSLLLGNFTLNRQVTVANQGSGITTLGGSGSASNPEFAGKITLERDVILDGATNTDRFTFSGGITGTGNVTIAGTGRVMFLFGSNSFNGNLTVNEGSTFQLHWGGPVSTADYIPNTSKLTVNGTLKLAKGNNGSETIGGLEGSGAIFSHDGVANVNSILVTDSASDHTFAGVLSDGGAAGAKLSLTKAGTGTQTLTGVNTYSGTTTINGGTLKLQAGGSIANTSAIVVAPGATLDAAEGGVTLGETQSLAAGDNAPAADVIGSVTSSGTIRPGGNGSLGTLTGITDLTLGGTLEWDRSSNSSASDTIAIQGKLTISPGLVVIPAGVGFSSSGTRTYTVVSGLTSPLTADDIANLPQLPPDHVWDTSVATALRIVHTQPGANLTWTGANGNAWDNAAVNWNGTPGVFQDGDSCTFDDSATGSTTVELPNDVAPAGVLVNNSTKTYTITSGALTGIIGDTSLIKTGSGLLVLSSSNIHTGGTTISGGTVAFTEGAISTSGPITMDGGALRWQDLNTQDISSSLVLIGGKPAFFDTNGNEVELKTTFGGGTNASVVKTGAGTLALRATASWTGNTEALEGDLVARSSSAFGATKVVVGRGAASAAVRSDANSVISNEITVSALGTGSATLGGYGSSSNPEFAGKIVLERDVILDGATNVDRCTFTGGITGTGNVTVAGTGRVMFLWGENSFNGNLTVNEGATFQLHWGGETVTTNYIPDTSKVTVNGTFKLAKGNNGVETIGGLEGTGTILSHEGVPNVNSILVTHSASDHTFAGVMSNGGASGTRLSFTKDGAGTQSLAGVNTYTGNTLVNAGTLNLLDNAALSFRVTNTANTTLSGAGTVVLDGDFAIDVSAVTVTSKTWQLEDVASLQGAYGATFRVVSPDGTAWTDAGNDTWTLKSGQLEFTFSEATGTLAVKAGGFSSWIASAEFGLAPADQDPQDDPDQDGLSNLVEYALAGRNPATADGAAGTYTNGTLSFTKRAEAAADAGISYQIQESDDLGVSDAWTEVPGGNGYTNDGTTISYTQPTGKVRNFVRLAVVQVQDA
jgi:fibronectin-binding autotransporter adhesin